MCALPYQYCHCGGKPTHYKRWTRNPPPPSIMRTRFAAPGAPFSSSPYPLAGNSSSKPKAAGALPAVTVPSAPKKRCLGVTAGATPLSRASALSPPPPHPELPGSMWKSSPSECSAASERFNSPPSRPAGAEEPVGQPPSFDFGRLTHTRRKFGGT